MEMAGCSIQVRGDVCVLKLMVTVVVLGISVGGDDGVIVAAEEKRWDTGRRMNQGEITREQDVFRGYNQLPAFPPLTHLFPPPTWTTD